MNWQVEYYKKENGDIPVEDFLLTLNPKIRAKAFRQIELLQEHGANLREPYVKAIKVEKYKGMFELRIKFATDISRIFYFTYIDSRFVLLNGFVKKSNKTPQKEFEKALKYRMDFEKRCEE